MSLVDAVTCRWIMLKWHCQVVTRRGCRKRSTATTDNWQLERRYNNRTIEVRRKSQIFYQPARNERSCNGVQSATGELPVIVRRRRWRQRQVPAGVESQAVSVSGGRTDGKPADLQLYVCPAWRRPALALPPTSSSTPATQRLYR